MARNLKNFLHGLIWNRSYYKDFQLYSLIPLPNSLLVYILRIYWALELMVTMCMTSFYFWSLEILMSSEKAKK